MNTNKKEGRARVIVAPLKDFQHDEGAILAQAKCALHSRFEYSGCRMNRIGFSGSVPIQSIGYSWLKSISPGDVSLAQNHLIFHGG